MGCPMPLPQALTRLDAAARKLSTSKRCRTRILRGWQGRRSARVDMTKRRLKSAVTSTTGPAFTPSVFYAKFEVEIGALFDEIAYLVEKTSDLTLPESRRRPLDSVATSLSRSAARFKRAGRTAAAFHSWDDLYRSLTDQSGRTLRASMRVPGPIRVPSGSRQRVCGGSR
jgi:hypothetical protein